MFAKLKTNHDNTCILVNASYHYFTQAFVKSNSNRKQIVIFNIDSKETRLEGSGEDEMIGDIMFPSSFNLIKVSVSYVDDNGNIVSADTLETEGPTKVGRCNVAWIRTKNSDGNDDYEVEIIFEGDA